MINAVQFENFKGFRSATTTLSPLTVIVGPNSSGKTSVLEGLHYLSQFARRPVSEILNGPRHEANLYYRGASGPMRLRWHAVEPDFQLRATFEPPTPGVDIDTVDDLSRLGHWAFALEVNELKTWKHLGSQPAETREAASRHSSAVMLRFEVSRLAEPSYSDQESPRLEFDGSGLATLLASMKLNNEDEFLRVQDALKRIVPSIERIRFRRRSVFREEFFGHAPRTPEEAVETRNTFQKMWRRYAGDELLFDMAGAKGVPARLMSEGTMLALGLLSILLGPRRPRLILMDDIDRALHPRGQKELVAVIRAFMQENPDVQLIATSHSPYLVDCLDYEQVRIMFRALDGGVRIGRPSEHPDFKKWKEEMAPGEFWSMIGEKWLAE